VPVGARDRVESMDIVRGLALFGVLQINLVTAFRVSLFREFETRHTDAGWLNHLTDDVLSIAVFSKAFALFTLLFGAGLGAQHQRADLADRPFGPFIVRRLAILLGIGLVHLFFINDGDILTTYALAGLVAAPFLGLPKRPMLALAIVALVAAVALPFPDLFGPDESMRAHIEKAETVYGHGTLVDVARFRFHEIRHIAPLLLASMPRTLGLMFLGIVAWRGRLFEAPPDRRTILRAIAVTGVVGGGAAQLVVFAARDGWVELPSLAEDVLIGLGDIALCLGYAAAIVCLAQKPGARRILGPFASVGRAALTNYLAQSVVFDLLFHGYGLGLFGRLGPASAAGLGAVIYALQVVVSHWWFRHFELGPVEWTWRSLTYGARQPLSRRRPT
jgi:uncharacterized protein